MKFLDVEVDERPGAYYVSVIDGAEYSLLSGPYPTHGEALEAVDGAKKFAHEMDPKAWFYAYGTCRLEESAGPGLLERWGLIREEGK